MGSPREAYAEARDEYLYGRGWKLRRCPRCSGNYFTKKEVGNCGSFSCCDGHKFPEIGSPRHPARLESITDSMTEFFSRRDYATPTPLGLVRKNERTLFASTAGQVFDKVIYEGEAPRDTKVFVIQPVVRLQKMDRVGVDEGISTSFLNAATEMWQAEPQDHIETLDHWLDFISASRLYVGNMCLKVATAIENWDGALFEASSLRINYAGLEIAIANFFSGTGDHRGASFSDISVGVERLIWAINKTSSYFDAIGPLSYSIDSETLLMDTLRTLTLMAAAGVSPGNKNHGYQFRSVAKAISDRASNAPIRGLVEYYYTQWARFIEPRRHRDSVERVVAKEIDRNLNLRTNELLGTGVDCEQSRENFLRELTDNGNVTPDRLRSAIEKEVRK